VRTIVFGRVGTLALAAAFAAVMGTAARAQDAAIDVSGFVDTYYGFNLNNPTDRKNGLHTFDAEHNSLALAVAEIAFEKKPTADSRVGFRLDLDFGPNAELVNAFEVSSFDSLKHVQQGYVSWLASDKLQVDFGKFVTPMGAEVIESKDNWNYTRSIQFGYAIPFYHTGFRATLSPSDKVSLAAFLVNGWNNVTDNNNDKTFGAQAVLKPSSRFTWANSVLVGKEATDSRLTLDSVLTFSPSDKLSLMANADYGKEGDLTWTAFSVYAKITAGQLAFAPRFEYLDDPDGFMTLGTKVMSYTLTTELKLGGGILARLDVRQDQADDPLFTTDTATIEKGQTTLTLGVAYAFGGKL